MYDRKAFFDSVRESLFNGVLSQRQVDGMSYLLDVWESRFADKPRNFLAYALATAFHETAYMMVPLEEYGRGSGKPYGTIDEEYGETYYGRGHVQITWKENYQKAEKRLKDVYTLDVPAVEYPHRLLEDGPSALVLYDGMIDGWFTGVGLPDYFTDEKEDPVNARKIVNGLDHAEKIAGYYADFKAALVEVA